MCVTVPFACPLPLEAYHSFILWYLQHQVSLIHFYAGLFKIVVICSVLWLSKLDVIVKSLIIHMKKKSCASDWLKISAFFMKHKCSCIMGANYKQHVHTVKILRVLTFCDAFSVTKSKSQKEIKCEDTFHKVYGYCHVGWEVKGLKVTLS